MISYLLLALCDFRTGSTAHQWVKPDMGRLVLETALRGGRITGDLCIFFNVDHLALARWCYTDKEEKEWEYCSPPGEVSSFQTYIPPLDRFLIHLGLMFSSGFGHSLYCQRPGLCWGMWNSRGEILVGMMSIVLLDECRCQLSSKICIFSTASTLVIETV